MLTSKQRCWRPNNVVCLFGSYSLNPLIKDVLMKSSNHLDRNFLFLRMISKWSWILDLYNYFWVVSVLSRFSFYQMEGWHEHTKYSFCLPRGNHLLVIIIIILNNIGLYQRQCFVIRDAVIPVRPESALVFCLFLETFFYFYLTTETDSLIQIMFRV